MGKWLKTAVLMFAVVLLVALTACSSDKTSNEGTSGGDNGSGDSEKGEKYDNGLPKDKKVTLTYVHREDGYGKEYADYAMETFHKKFPNVSFDVQYAPQTKKIVNTKIQAGSDKDMFNMFGDDQDGATMIAAAKEKSLVKMEDLWDHKLYDTPDKTVKDVAVDGVYDGRPLVLGESYRLPLEYGGYGMYFNKNLFDEHGWNQDPQTWDEFVDLVKTIKDEGDGISPMIFPGVYATYINDAFGVQKELELADENGTHDEYLDRVRNVKAPKYTTDEKKEVWNRIYEMGKKGYFDKGLPAIDHIQSQMYVIQGRAAMIADGSWVAGEMKDKTPDGFHWGYMSIPMKSSKDTPFHMKLSPGHGIYIWNNKPDLEVKWAKEFAVWEWNMDVQEKLAEHGAIPIRKDFTDDPDRKKKLDEAAQGLFDFINNHDTVTEQTGSLRSIDSPYSSQASENFKENIPVIATGKKDPIPVLEKSEKLFEKALKDDKSNK